MVRNPFQPVLWMLMAAQALGLCCCMVAEVTAVEPGAAAYAALASDHCDNDQDRPDCPADETACHIKLSLKVETQGTYTAACLLASAVADLVPPPRLLAMLPGDSAGNLGRSPLARNLPLLI